MGRHEPPTNRSLYLSVAASTLRFAIIVALVVGGVVVINQAFQEPQTADGGTISDGGVPTQTQSPSPSASPSESESPREQPSPTITGTVVAVFNTTSTSGLAGDTLATLIDQYGYVEGQPVDDAPTMAVTTIYYAKARDKVEAEFLAGDFFRRLDQVDVRRLPDGADVDSSVQLAIYLGTDYAALA